MYKSATLKVIVFPSLSYTVHILSLEKLRTLETQSHVQEQRYSLFGGLGSSLHIYWYIGSKKILYTMFLKHMAHMFQAFAPKRELHLQWFLVSFKALPSTTTAFQHTNIYIYKNSAYTVTVYISFETYYDAFLGDGFTAPYLTAHTLFIKSHQ